MARTDNLKNYLTDVADAIREKTNTTDKIKASEFDDKIKEISGASEQWEWALNNVINFGSANPTFFKGMTYLKVLPNYFEDKCLEITNWTNAFNGCTNLTEVNINTSNGTNFNSIFYNCSKLTNIINVDDFSNGTNFQNAFRNTKLTDDVIQKFNFDKITNGLAMFGYGTPITKLPNFNHETITDMKEMFWQSSLSDLGENDLSFPLVTTFASAFGNSKITKMPNLSIPKATTTYRTFSNCTLLTEIGNIEAPLVTDLNDMFNGCTNLEAVGNLSFDICTNINGAFYNCTNLKTIRVLFIPKVQTFNNPFYNCKTLESIEQLNVSSATNLVSLFAQSNNLKFVDFANSTSKVTNFSNLFLNKTVLETVKGLDLSSATNVSNMFIGCSSLKNLTFAENSIKISLNLENSSLLTDESVQSLISGLATVEATQTLTLHSDIISKLTEEQKATISSKNWNIVSGEGKRTALEVTSANTLIATIGSRTFTKVNDGLAIACTAKFSNYTGILLVSEIEDAVTYIAYNRTVKSAGNLTYNNKTYYYSGRDWMMSDNNIDSGYPYLNDITQKTYTNDNNGSTEASTDLLNYYFNK